MTEKEVSEIRRRFKNDKNNITRIRGCYISEKKEIVSEFNQSFLTMTESESETMLTILKKTLSGSIGKNLINIDFSTNQVLSGEEQKTLLTLKNSELEDDEAAHAIYDRIRTSVEIEGNYIIFLACDKYDVFSYSRDDTKEADSDYTFTYFICCVCPVKLTKPALSYYSHENKFHSVMANSVVCAPELGFMFPTFDDRTANIYSTLFYTKNTEQSRDDVVDALFKCNIPMPAEKQKEVFETIISDSLNDDCSFEITQSVHEKLCEMIADHKESKDNEPLVVSKETVKKVLESSGAEQKHIDEFDKKYDETFGSGTEIPPANLVDTKRFEVSTPDVVVKVNPERSDLVETRIIDGTKYILIRADDNVQVNGVQIHIH